MCWAWRWAALSMSLAFEHYTGVATAANLTTANPLGFVAALNITFLCGHGLVQCHRASYFGARRTRENHCIDRRQPSLINIERLNRCQSRERTMAEKIIYLNGSFVPESEAKVSVLDSGFNAGDGVYDVTRTFAHKPFRLRDHTARLFRSLRYTRIDCGFRAGGNGKNHS